MSAGCDWADYGYIWYYNSMWGREIGKMYGNKAVIKNNFTFHIYSAGIHQHAIYTLVTRTLKIKGQDIASINNCHAVNKMHKFLTPGASLLWTCLESAFIFLFIFGTAQIFVGACIYVVRMNNANMTTSPGLSLSQSIGMSVLAIHAAKVEGCTGLLGSTCDSLELGLSPISYLGSCITNII